MITVKSFRKIRFGYAFVIGIAISSIVEAQQFEQNIVAIEVEPQFVKYDAKTYPGISCEAQAVVEIDLFMNLGFDMVNANAGKRTVVCPIIRDNTENTDGTYAAYVYVNNPANRTLECSLFSFDKFGSFIDADTNSTSSSGDQTIYLDVDSSIKDGYYGITCLLPNAGVVRSYEVREYLDTDNEGGFLSIP